jgi:hypothetical protein
MSADSPLLSPVGLARLAAAYELSEDEVLADAPTIVDWPGPAAELDAWLNARHRWQTGDEYAYYFVRSVRAQVWLTENQLPALRA